MGDGVAFQGDEQRVIDHIMGTCGHEVAAKAEERLRRGAVDYGPLSIKNYPRDVRKERAEEALDLLVYTAIGVLRGELDVATQLSAVQARCTELLLETRALRAENEARRVENEALKRESATLMARVAALKARLDLVGAIDRDEAAQ